MVAFTEEQQARRRLTIGASEIPVLAGCVPFKSPITLWQEKTGARAGFDGNEFTEWGNRLEAVVADKYAEVMMAEIRPSESIIHPVDTWRSCTPDRLVYFNGQLDRGYEGKCRGEYRADEWGEPGTDEVPHDVAIQCQWSMGILGLPRWDVGTLIGGNKFRLYHLVYDREIDESLIEIAREFWFDYVIPNVQPPIDASAATGAWLKKQFGSNTEPLRAATVDEAVLIETLKDVRETKKVFEEREQEVKNLLMAAIGPAAGIECPSGKVTWKAPNGSITAWKDVAIEAGASPEIIARHSKPQSRRFLPTFPKKK